MDPKHLDALAKLVGSGQSRRRVLSTLAGGAVASVATAIGRSSAGAASKLRATGNSCTVNSDCATGLCVQQSRTRKICQCASANDCPSGEQCRTPICASGACSLGTAADGSACDDGLGVGSGLCQSGACAVNPLFCAPVPDYFGNCAPGQYCEGSTCACHVAVCSTGPDCGPYFDGCLDGCCCAENGNQFVGCAPGHNNDCCSGYCGDDQLCVAAPV